MFPAKWRSQEAAGVQALRPAGGVRGSALEQGVRNHRVADAGGRSSFRLALLRPAAYPLASTPSASPLRKMSCVLPVDLPWTKLVLELAMCVNMIFFGYLDLDSKIVIAFT